jgi:hypothetical protein
VEVKKNFSTIESLFPGVSRRRRARRSAMQLRGAGKFSPAAGNPGEKEEYKNRINICLCAGRHLQKIIRQPA